MFFVLSIYPLTPIDVTKEINLLQNGEIIRVHNLIEILKYIAMHFVFV